jgi:GAF domain-containing protein
LGNDHLTRKYLTGLESLLGIARKLAAAKDLNSVTEIVGKAARELVQADGATFVLREGDFVHYVDEAAISPLWKGSKFPIRACISGWAILERQSLIIPDIYSDPRVPVDSYRRTFVKSLAMVPMRISDPVGAVGVYWSRSHTAGPDDLRILQYLADLSAGAIETASSFEKLSLTLEKLEQAKNFRIAVE